MQLSNFSKNKINTREISLDAAYAENIIYLIICQ